MPKALPDTGQSCQGEAQSELAHTLKTHMLTDRCVLPGLRAQNWRHAQQPDACVTRSQDNQPLQRHLHLPAGADTRES